MKAHRIEWLGVRSPLEGQDVSYYKMVGAYTLDEEADLVAMAQLAAPRIRQDGCNVRLIGPDDGFSHWYQFGPKRHEYTVDMLEIDVDRLFRGMAQAEFRDHDNPAHDERVPVIPVRLTTKRAHEALQRTWNGPPVVVFESRSFTNTRELGKALGVI